MLYPLEPVDLIQSYWRRRAANAPFRLAVGSHDRGTGRGCAMNLLSWQRNDRVITDYPDGSHWALARMVQIVNDDLCTHTERHELDLPLMCESCSSRVMSLAYRTVGTDGASRDEINSWLAHLGHRLFNATPENPVFKQQVHAATHRYLRPQIGVDVPDYGYRLAEWENVKLRRAHRAIDVWDRITNHKAPTPDPKATADAYRRMVGAR